MFKPVVVELVRTRTHLKLRGSHDMFVSNTVRVENSCQAVVGWVYLCTQNRFLGKEEKKVVLVDTLPSVINAPPALDAQVRVTMLFCVFTLLLLSLGEPACVRRAETAQEDPNDPQGILFLSYTGRCRLYYILMTGILLNLLYTFGSMAVALPPFWRPPTIGIVKQPEKRNLKLPMLRF